jgi:hypothetical protein
MHARLALLAIGVCVAAFGCSTPQQQAGTPSSASAAAPSNSQKPTQQARYRTGSRVPLPEGDGGAQSVSGVSKDDYEDEMRRMVTPSGRF